MDTIKPAAIIQQIVSGGQTGVDRGALDAAIWLGISHGGWCPRGRRAEDGIIPSVYRLREHASRKYHTRTEQNVIDSDGTLILYRGQYGGGTQFTDRMTIKHSKPCLRIDLGAMPDSEVVRHWIQVEGIAVLNVAGPRGSSDPDISDAARTFLVAVLNDG